jgi:hypothetical protein
MRIVLKLEIYCFFFLSYSLICSAQSDVKTNLQICASLYGQIIEETGRASRGSAECLCIRRLDQGHPLDWLVLQQWYQWARQNSISAVYEDSTCSDTLGCVYAEYRPLSRRILYREKHGDQGNWQRIIECELAITLRKANKEIVFADTKSRHYEDVIAKRDIHIIEDSEIVRGEQPKQGLAAKLFQPVVISLATAAVIYTFYSFRSR